MLLLGIGALVEFSSFIGAYIITTKGAIDGILQITEAGYKYDAERIQQDIKEKEEEHNNAKKTNLLARFLVFVPGVNLVMAKIATDRAKKELKASIPEYIEKGYIVEMSDKEKEQYSKLDNNMHRLLYSVVHEDEDTEFMGFVGNRPIVVDHGLTSLYYDRLMPMAYTLDEVKKLNAATNFSYRLGMVDGISTAIIGIPNPDSKVKRVHYNTDPIDVEHEFIPMSEEDAKNNTFIIYPFVNVYEDEEFNRCFENLRKDRYKSSDYSFSKSDIKNIKIDKPKVLTKTLYK